MDGDIDANPAALELMDCLKCGGTAAKGVEHHITLVAAGLDDALQQRQRLLRGIAYAFPGLGIDGDNVVPHIIERHTCQADI